MENMTIRMATINDASEMLKIYEPHILNTAITFEYEKVPLIAFQERLTKILEQFPWLVCCIDGNIAGYAYCSPHFERAAFAWDCECSVYVSEQFKQRGVASALYNTLFRLIKEQGYYNVYALICVPNESSEALHIKYGFTSIGVFRNTAFKLGQWRDLLIMEKKLQPILGEPKHIISINQLDIHI